MVLYAAPSPRRSNHTQLYLNKKGELIDGRTGSYWGMSGMARLKIAKDAALPDITPAPGAMPNPERDAEERLDAMRRDIEILIDSGHLDLADKSRGQIIEVLNRHCGAATQHRRNGADKPARDEEHHEGLRKLLREKGLQDDEIEKAIQIVKDKSEPKRNGKDRLPVSGPGGMGGYRSNQSRQPNEKVYRGRDDFAERFPEVARVQAFPEEYEWREKERARDRRHAYDLAMDGNKADRLAEMFGTHFTEIGIGCWPARR